MNMSSNVTDDDKIQFTIAQLVPLTLYCCLASLFGLFGNGLVLYSSLRYNAIRLDRVALIFVKNLAIADIIYTVCLILPQAVTYLARRWVLGPVYCFIAAQISFIPGSANSLTVLALTSYRLRLILSPFYSISEWTVRFIVVGIWVVSLAGTVVSLSYQSSSLFDVKTARCLSSVYVNKAAKVPFLSSLGLIIILPIFLITIFNSLLAFFAIRSSRKSRNQAAGGGSAYKAIVMVCSLSGLFIVSWVPYLLFTVMKMKTPDLPSIFTVISFHCIFISSFGNPILYSLTNKRFGKYVAGVLRSVVFCSRTAAPRKYPANSSGTSSTGV